MSKPLDMADKYDSTYDPDEEITIKVVNPWFKVVKENEVEVMYPGLGLLIVVVSGCAFWGAVIYLFCR
jgi:hypothetical protein